jgi:organic radical activating enzyme
MIEPYNPDTYCWYAFSGYDSNHKWCCCVGLGDLQNFQQLNQSPKIQEIRQDLKNGIKHPDCWRCWRPESIGESSTRMVGLKWIQDTMPQGNYYDPKLRALWLDSGTVCNLACRTCGAMWSSTHLREVKDRFGPTGAEHFKIQKTDLPYLLEEDFSNIYQIFVIGGEPFLNLDHLKVLEKIVADGHAHQCKITYLTNGTLPIPERLLKIIPEFKAVNFMVSIDGVGPSFEYTRTKANWIKYVENFQHMRKQITSNNSLFFFNITISVLNVLRLTEIMTWIGEQVGDQTLPIEQRVAQLKAMGHMGMTTIVDPSYYTLNVLTSEQKAQVREYLKASPYDMSNVLNALDAENYKYSESAAQKFWEEVAWTESYHGMGLPDYLPELYRILRP